MSVILHLDFEWQVHCFSSHKNRTGRNDSASRGVKRLGLKKLYRKASETGELMEKEGSSLISVVI